jgi:hypothetical protein
MFVEPFAICFVAIGEHALPQFMVFLIGFSNKKIPKMTSVKKTTLSIWTSLFGLVNVMR